MFAKKSIFSLYIYEIHLKVSLLLLAFVVCRRHTQVKNQALKSTPKAGDCNKSVYTIFNVVVQMSFSPVYSYFFLSFFVQEWIKCTSTMGISSENSSHKLCSNVHRLGKIFKQSYFKLSFQREKKKNKVICKIKWKITDKGKYKKNLRNI